LFNAGNRCINILKKKSSAEWLKVKGIVFIWKTEVCINTGYSLNGTKSIENLTFILYILKNSKNQILNHCIIKEKIGMNMSGEHFMHL